jgi:hypothetical protein
VPKLNIDIPEELKRWLESEAQRRGVSQRVVTILALERASADSGIMGDTPPKDETHDGGNGNSCASRSSASNTGSTSQPLAPLAGDRASPAGVAAHPAAPAKRGER